MFVAVSFRIVQTWKECKYLSMRGWINQVLYIYTTECFKPIKKKLMICKTWLKL